VAIEPIFEQIDRRSRVVPAIFVIGGTLVGMLLLFVAVSENNQAWRDEPITWLFVVVVSVVYVAGIAALTRSHMRPQRVVLDQEGMRQWSGDRLTSSIRWVDVKRMQIYREKARIGNHTYVRIYGNGHEIEIESGGDAWPLPRAQEMVHIARTMIVAYSPSATIDDGVGWLASSPQRM